MKVVVIGGTGLIGGKVTGLLREQGHEVVAASPGTGVDAVTGEGLAAALHGADVLVDVANSPSFEATAVLEFFRASSTNLIAAGKAAGVRHHVVLSVVGADRQTGSGYMRAKVAQEQLVEGGGVPFTIVRATQFHQFVAAIIAGTASGGVSQLPPAPFQPVDADEVAAAVADAAVSAPVNGTVEVGGPEVSTLDETARRYLTVRGVDGVTSVATDATATYFGADVSGGELVTGPDARLGKVTFAEYLGAGVGTPAA